MGSSRWVLATVLALALAPEATGQGRAERAEQLIGRTRADVEAHEGVEPVRSTDSTLTFVAPPEPFEEVTYTFRDGRLYLVAHVGYPDALSAEIAYDLEKYALMEAYDEPPLIEEPFDEETSGVRALWLWPGLAVSLIVERDHTAPSGHRLTLRYFVPGGE